MAKLRFLGHACFTFSEGEHTLLFDPFLSDNPFKIIQPQEISCTYILISHGHFDHLGDAITIGKKNNATVISTAEIANLCQQQGLNAHAMHLGGKHKFDFGSVRLTLAFHGAGVPGGHACGFVVTLGNKTIYFAGDTALFGDMQLIGKLESIDYALLPIGDNFTMGPDDAVIAAELLNPKCVIPMHYNTWPLIAQNPQEFKQKVEARTQARVHILNPGETLTL